MMAPPEPVNLAVVPGADGWPVAYDYAVGGRRHRFDMTGPMDPVCHIRSFHPQDDHYGLSPLQAAAVAAIRPESIAIVPAGQLGTLDRDTAAQERMTRAGGADCRDARARFALQPESLAQ